MRDLGSEWLGLPRAWKLAAAAAVCVVVVATRLVVIAVARKPEIFYTGPLEVPQVLTFLLCFGSWATYVLFEYAFPRLTGDANGVSGEALVKARGVAEFALYMVIFYVVDRTTLLPRREKQYNFTTFWSLWAILLGVSLLTLIKARAPPERSVASRPPPAKAESDGASAAERADPASPPPSPTAEDDPEDANGPTSDEAAVLVVVLYPEAEPSSVFHVPHLSRDQTEEWKGWMQVLFLWYHYFNNKSIYNLIRLFIAAYVWMTGFGNFSYYYVRADFSLARFCQMQWRLNFMVLWTCLILGNEYMLYYICPLHTLFTVLIYVTLGVLPHLNATAVGMTIKCVIITVLSLVMWDTIPPVFMFIWRPLTFLVQYHDPQNPTRNPLSEWFFRTFLDHYIWIVGMICAFNHPTIDEFLQRIDRLPKYRSWATKLIIVAGVLCVLSVYVEKVFRMDRETYVKWHPYTSFIPILSYLVLRNIFMTARMYHIHLFEYLGKVTLETYIAQFHVWMATTGRNGGPRKLLRLLPPEYPLLDFAIFSLAFLFMSFRLFHTTTIVRTVILPSGASNGILVRNLCTTGGVLAIAALIAWAIQ